jgi:hypothetical protein
LPTLAQMEAATPKCPHVDGRSNVRFGGAASAPPEARCGKPCRYVAKRNVWKCPVHGEVLAGELLGAMNTGAMIFDEVPG